jgi:hypothetical protein
VFVCKASLQVSLFGFSCVTLCCVAPLDGVVCEAAFRAETARIWVRGAVVGCGDGYILTGLGVSSLSGSVERGDLLEMTWGYVGRIILD